MTVDNRMHDRNATQRATAHKMWFYNDFIGKLVVASFYTVPPCVFC